MESKMIILHYSYECDIQTTIKKIMNSSTERRESELHDNANNRHNKIFQTLEISKRNCFAKHKY